MSSEDEIVDFSNEDSSDSFDIENYEEGLEDSSEEENSFEKQISENPKVIFASCRRHVLALACYFPFMVQ